MQKQFFGVSVLVAALAVAAAAYVWLSGESGSGGARVSLPQLTATAQAGQKSFNATCAACHGQDGSGSDAGPPLIHKIYEPSHHGDFSFVRAVTLGVRAHHWRFGNMPRVPEISQAELQDIITFVREVQRHNGIH